MSTDSDTLPEPTYADRVRWGAAFLDAYHPDRQWADKINVDSLDMAGNDTCVLGQTYKTEHDCDSYGATDCNSHGFNAFIRDFLAGDGNAAAHFGFTLSNDRAVEVNGGDTTIGWIEQMFRVGPIFDEYRLLADAWRDYLTQRRTLSQTGGAR